MTRKGIKLFRALGFLLILGGMAVGFEWFVRMAPVRKVWDPAWVNSHSSQEYWQELQVALRRGFWGHDGAHELGFYGDHRWTTFLMGKIRPGTDLGCEGPISHASTALRLMSNQDYGDGSDAWLAWWAANRGKKQSEWITEGFAKAGIPVSFPPTADQTAGLLRLLNPSSDNPRPPPEHIRFNAYRWLRDSGFDPVDYALGKHDITDQTACGLRAYEGWARRYPRPAAPERGRADDTSDHEGDVKPEILAPAFQRIMILLTVGPVLLGLYLLVRVFKMEREQP